MSKRRNAESRRRARETKRAKRALERMPPSERRAVMAQITKTWQQKIQGG